MIRDREARMPIRVVVYLNVGPAFGGFRVAGRVQTDAHAAEFQELERAVDAARHLLSAHDPEDWPPLTDADAASAVPRYQGRTGQIDFTGGQSPEGVDIVVARALLPFSFWPLGGLAVYEAWHRGADGGWAPVPQEELAEKW